MKILAGIFAVVVLLVLLVFALPFLIDLNKYQEQYRPIIEEALNRKITLQSIRLTIFPRIGARVEGFTVMDDPAFGTVPFASLKSLDVGVKLRPLLSKRVEVEEITLRDPVITVIKNREGVTNVSTLGPKGAAKPAPVKPEGPPSPQPAGNPLQALALLAVDRVSITGGKITYRDLSKAQPSEYVLNAFEFHLNSVRLGASPDLQLSTTVMPMNLPVAAKGTFGPLAETPDLKNFDFVVSVGKVALTLTGSAVGGNLNVTAKSPLINTADLPVAVPLAKPIGIKDLHLTAHATYPLKQGGPPLELADIKDFGLQVVMGNSLVNVNGTVLDGHARVTANAPTINSADLPVALPLKKPLDVKDVQLAADLQGQEARLGNLSLNLFNGQIKSQGGMTLGVHPSPFNGKVSVQGLQLGPLLDAVGTEKVSVSGTTAADLSLQGQGFTKGDLTRALKGTGHFEVRDGKIEGLNVLTEAMALLKVVGISQENFKATVFSSITGDIGIDQGIVAVKRLLIDSHDYQMTAMGTVGFDQTLDLKANLVMSEGLSKKIGASSPVAKLAFNKDRMTIPLLITGTGQSPVLSLDAKTFSGKVQEQVKEKVGEAVDDLLKGKSRPEDLQKKGEDLLKGLLGR